MLEVINSLIVLFLTWTQGMFSVTKWFYKYFLFYFDVSFMKPVINIYQDVPFGCPTSQGPSWVQTKCSLSEINLLKFH